MTRIREEAMKAEPDFPWLRAGDCAGVQGFLAGLGWIDQDESVDACDPAGAGNMNLTLRVVTQRRTCILKQARPWVEKYDEIAAPWDRSLSEGRFYARIADIPEVATAMPRLLAQDPSSRTLLLEALDGTGDYSDLYDPASNGTLDVSEVERAASTLGALHQATRGESDGALANAEMRALNFSHIFEVPFDPENGLDLEPWEAGLANRATALQRDPVVRERIAVTGGQYLEQGPCLLHGDYFPGSWLRSSQGLRVIDPEFCFFGAPEIDLGCAIAHLALAQRPLASARDFLAVYTKRITESIASPGLDLGLLSRFAAVEVMRRLIGVAQLPIPAGLTTCTATGEALGLRGALLLASRRALLEEDWVALWKR